MGRTRSTKPNAAPILGAQIWIKILNFIPQWACGLSENQLGNASRKGKKKRRLWGTERAREETWISIRHHWNSCMEEWGWKHQSWERIISSGVSGILFFFKILSQNSLQDRVVEWLVQKAECTNHSVCFLISCPAFFPLNSIMISPHHVAKTQMLLMHMHLCILLVKRLFTLQNPAWMSPFGEAFHCALN